MASNGSNGTNGSNGHGNGHPSGSYASVRSYEEDRNAKSEDT